MNVASSTNVEIAVSRLFHILASENTILNILIPIYRIEVNYT
ncbi:MAG: hypothetical protein QXF21_05920 [Thermoproteota archaeon]